MAVFLYALLTPGLFYLGSRAVVTRWLWSRYPPRLAAFMDCSACTGFWYGLFLAITLGRWYDLNYLGIEGRIEFTPLAVGLGSMTWTPILSALVQWSFDTLGSVSPNP